MDKKLISMILRYHNLKKLNKYTKLSKLIDVYLIPQELEKKQNAEISTPYKLRQDMISGN